MSCAHIYDFISGSKITLPHPRVIRERRDERRDIVRPNQEAEQLVLRHVEMLQMLASDESPILTKH